MTRARLTSTRPTARDVAAIAGVSVSMVSRALRPEGSVNADKRRLIEAAARKVGYQPNPFAAAISTGRSNTVGLVVAEETTLHFPQVVVELAAAFKARGLATMLFVVAHREETAGVLDKLSAYRLDGIVCCNRLAGDLLARATSLAAPLVLYNQDAEGAALSSVSADHRGAGRLVGRALRERGHERVAFVAGPTHSRVAALRLQGVVDTLGYAPVAVVEGDFSQAGGAHAAAKLLEARRPPTAIVAASDMMAIGVLQTAAVRGIAVPTALSVVGFDDIAIAAWPCFALTTVAQPLARMAAATVQVTQALIADRTLPDERRLLDVKLIIRRSLGPV